MADVAAARYYQATRPGLLDPVVTGNGDRLRFESFSGCCGVYARLDVLREGLDGAETGHGAPNAAVNAPLREALSRTCRWWAGHRGRRGPCKRALAVHIE